MEIYNGIKVQYVHKAIPPHGIKLNRAYQVSTDGNRIFIIDDYEKELTLSEYLLRTLFDLVNGEWEDLDKEETK